MVHLYYGIVPNQFNGIFNKFSHQKDNVQEETTQN